MSWCEERKKERGVGRKKEGGERRKEEREGGRMNNWKQEFIKYSKKANLGWTKCTGNFKVAFELITILSYEYYDL